MKTTVFRSINLSAASRLLGVAVLLAGPLPLVDIASADNTYWTNPTLGNWFINSNWTNGVPTSCSSCNHQAIITQGTAWINTPGAQADFLAIGGGFGGNLWITNGGTLFQREETIIHNPITSAIVSVIVSDSQSAWNAPEANIFVGGNGTLRIENGGVVGSASGRVASYDSGLFHVRGDGTVLITGAGSTWALKDLEVGAPAHFSNGNGSTTMTISGGGNLLSTSASIGGTSSDFGVGSRGTVTVTGPGSIWDNAESLYVGAQDYAGALRINSSAYVRTGHLEISSVGSVEVNNGSSTTAGLIVDGGASHVSAGSSRGSLIVANTSSGRMVVQSSGKVLNSFGTIGANSGTTGSVLVHGAGSTWTNTDKVTVGHSGTGTLEVRNGGTLTSFQGVAGANANSTGMITVSDPGSTWNASGSFFIGNSGSGLLEVLNGGVASTTGNSHLGINVGAMGDVNVSGAGSTLNVGVLLNIGGDGAGARGAGSVRIADGGTVNVGSATNLYANGRIDLVGTTTFTGDVNSFGGGIRPIGNPTLANAVHLNAGGLFVDNFSSATFTGIIDGAGGLIKSGIAGFTGLGTLTLTAANTYTGATTVRAGTLLVDGSITSATTVNSGATLGGSGVIAADVINNGFVAPGNSPGTLSVMGNYTQNSGGRLKIELSSPTSFDRLAVTGALALGGTLEISLIDGFTPTADQTFDIFSSGSLTGAFSSVILPSQEGLTWDASQLAMGVISVDVINPPLAAADFDEDGDVDGDDLAAWTAGFGTADSATHMQGDADGEEDVDGADFLVWQQQLDGGAGDLASSAAVPEPAAVLLLGQVLAISLMMARAATGDLLDRMGCGQPLARWAIGLQHYKVTS